MVSFREAVHTRPHTPPQASFQSSGVFRTRRKESLSSMTRELSFRIECRLLFRAEIHLDTSTLTASFGTSLISSTSPEAGPCCHCCSIC